MLPHKNSMGFQALILCGPGGSLGTFNSRPEEFPKCLIPVANRPMVYYAIDFCKQSGITDITLIAPPSSLPAIVTALEQNPYLTSHNVPSVSVLAPTNLHMTMGTAELLRLPEVQLCIRTNFIILPCDIVCELSGDSILEAWITTQAILKDNSSSGGPQNRNRPRTSYFDHDKRARRGGLAVYYQTDGREEGVPEEATDLVAIGPLDQDDERIVPPCEGPSRPRFNLSKLLISMPMDTAREKMSQNKGLSLRHSLMQNCSQVKLLTTFRDAHIYVFPLWVKDLVQYQAKLNSISEDLIGNWAKTAWQKGLGDKIGLTRIFTQDTSTTNEPPTSFTTESSHGGFVDEEIDLRRMSTTKGCLSSEVPVFRSCLRNPKSSFFNVNEATETTDLPQLLASVHRGSKPFIRRVDNTAILLSTSLLLAKLPSIHEVGHEAASPFAHAQKIAYPEGVASPSTVTTKDCLLDRNVIVEATAVLKESVIGARCHIGRGARLLRCVLMDEVVIEPRADLTGCVIGRRAQIGRECVLRNCEVQDAHAIPERVVARDEKLMVDVTLSE